MSKQIEDIPALLEESREWLKELENLLAIRAMYYGEEQLLAKDVEMGHRLTNAVRSMLITLMAIQHYEPDREHDAELRRTVLTKIQNIACGRIGGHIGENCGCFKKGMLDIPQDSVAKLNQIIEITDNELRKLY